MPQVSPTSVCNTIANTLWEIDAVKSGAVQKPGELSEGISDYPTLQVYLESHGQDESGSTDRSSFGGGVRRTRMTVHVDLYARERRDLGEDMAALLNLVDVVSQKFEEQDDKPYFGLEGIKAFQWDGSRILFTYGDPMVSYVGWRWTITIWLF